MGRDCFCTRTGLGQGLGEGGGRKEGLGLMQEERPPDNETGMVLIVLMRSCRQTSSHRSRDSTMPHCLSCLKRTNPPRSNHRIT